MRGLTDAPETVRIVVTISLLVAHARARAVDLGPAGGAPAHAPVPGQPHRALRRAGELAPGQRLRDGRARGARAPAAAVPHPDRPRHAGRRSTAGRWRSCTGPGPIAPPASAWAIGCSLAALAGILIAPSLGAAVARQPHPADRQRLRRGHVRPAAQPADDLRRRGDPRPRRLLRDRLHPERQRLLLHVPLRDPGGHPVRRAAGAAEPAAAHRAGVRLAGGHPAAVLARRARRPPRRSSAPPLVLAIDPQRRRRAARRRRSSASRSSRCRWCRSPGSPARCRCAR